MLQLRHYSSCQFRQLTMENSTQTTHQLQKRLKKKAYWDYRLQIKAHSSRQFRQLTIVKQEGDVVGRNAVVAREERT